MIATGLNTETSTELLRGLDSSDEKAWREFDRRYRGIILGFATRIGLTPFDAADLAQETLTLFLKEYRAGKYDRERGRLRSWLIGMARHRAADMARRSRNRRETRGESAILDRSGDEELGRLWDEEARRAVLSRAMEELRESKRVGEQTLTIFERLMLDQQAPQDVADSFDIPVQAVYKAKHRCLMRLRSILDRLTHAYELS